MTSPTPALPVLADRRVLLSLLTLAVQAAAAVYFIVDGVDDVLEQASASMNTEWLMECLVALALLIAVVAAAHQLRRRLEHARRQEAALLAARGSMAELLRLRFEQWNLSRSEADVALFALKGCTIAEIAAMRNSAEGTVRSQLSQVYAKADVSSQAMLIAQFIEELIET